MRSPWVRDSPPGGGEIPPGSFRASTGALEGLASENAGNLSMAAFGSSRRSDSRRDRALRVKLAQPAGSRAWGVGADSAALGSGDHQVT